MKKILFDLLATQPNVSGKRHGGGKYGEIVFTEIVKQKRSVICFYDSNRWLNPEIRSLIEQNHISLFDINKIELSEIVEQEKVDAIYSPLPGNLQYFDKCNVIGTIHGMRELELPLDWFFFKYKSSFKSRIKFLLQKFIPSIGYKKDRKVCGELLRNPKFRFVMVSNHSIYALKSYCPEFKDVDVRAFYSPSTSTHTTVNQKYRENFFLLVSGNRWEKNNLRAIIALDKLFSRGFLKDYSVKITGVSDSSIFKYKIQNSEKFSFMGYVDEDELDQLYHDAYCLVYPSLNEGFGYPPIEAMHYGTPVIAAPFSSIPEICGDAVIYTNPYAIEEIMARIMMISKPQEKEKFSHRSIVRYERITQMQKDDLSKLIDYIYE